MKKKINKQLTGIAILAIVATVIGITGIYYHLFQQQVQGDLAISTRILSLAPYFQSSKTPIEEIDLSSQEKTLRVTWIAEDGTVLYDNDVSKEKMPNHLNRPEIQEAFEKGEGKSVRHSDTLNKNTFYYALLLENGTVLRVATDAKSLWSVFLSVAPVIAVIVCGIIGVCVVLSHFLTKQLLKPIEMMALNIENAEYESPYNELEPFSEMLRVQRAEILSAAKARQDFTANVSHELKTPLTSILGYAELLENGMEVEEQRIHFCREIHKNAERLLALINDILRLSEMDQGYAPEFENLDLYEAVCECMEGLQVNARQRQIMLALGGEHCTIRGNRFMIKELIENLVQNAIRYNNPEGKVMITVEKREDRTILMVKDNGIGIPASEQQRIFERFYRVDKSRSKATGGTGLGLAIVKHIVEIHDAKLELDSAPGVGTTITVWF